MNIERIYLEEQKWPGDRNIKCEYPIDYAAWIWHPDSENEPSFVEFRLEFECGDSVVPIHVSADQRYELFIDGERVGAGPDRGDVEHWSFSSWNLQLESGKHELVAKVWWLGELSPQALITNKAGFICASEGEYAERINTGTAEWQVLSKKGVLFKEIKPPYCYHDIGQSQWTDYSFWNEEGRYVDASVVRVPVEGNEVGVDSGGEWILYPSVLPDLLYEKKRVGSVRAVIDSLGNIDGGMLKVPSMKKDSELVELYNTAYQGGVSLRISPHQKIEIIIDLEDYYTGYPSLSVKGGKDSIISWEWAESLYDSFNEPEDEGQGYGCKGNRDEVEGKFWMGFGHGFTCDGNEIDWTPYWWCSGRYVKIHIETADEDLAVNDISIIERRYPLENELPLESSNTVFDKIFPMCLRSLQACSHDSYMDCPYYEQMMYVGDTRLELLTHYVLQSDRRLAKRSIELFDQSRSRFGFVAERCTSRMKQQCNSFAAIWTLCLHDYAKWNKQDVSWIKDRLLGMRANLDCFLPYRNEDGLLYNEPGWTFIDWVNASGWKGGYAPGYRNGRCCGLLNQFYLLALKAAADLECHYGSRHHAEYYNELADQTAGSIRERFWNEQRGFLADDLSQVYYSQHMQCLGVISGVIFSAERESVLMAALKDKSLAQCSIYFKFYWLEALSIAGLEESLLQEFDFWEKLVDAGLKTCVESPEPTRSDCHAWGAHVIYHWVCNVIGVQPTELGRKGFYVKDSRSEAEVILDHFVRNEEIQWGDSISKAIDHHRFSEESCLGAVGHVTVNSQTSVNTLYQNCVCK